LVGPEEVPIAVHAAAISGLSEPLDRLINGGMREAQENRARLRDLEKEDFERICEYAYRGDYTVPDVPISAVLNSDLGDDVEDSPSDSDVEFYVSPSPSESEFDGDVLQSTPPTQFRALGFRAIQARHNTSRKSVQATKADDTAQTGLERLTTHFRGRQYLRDGPLSGVISKSFTPFMNIHATQDFGPVFLAYARIYAFAEQYMVEKLKELTLKKLHETLKFFTLYPSGRPSVMQLVRFAYDNDYIPDHEVTGSMDPLRELVVEYMAMHAKDRRHDRGHRQFLPEQGEYARDLVEAIHQWRL
jgi:hypothetical protein